MAQLFKSITINPEYQGEILTIMRYDTQTIIFDTNVADPSEYEYFYLNGFDWAFVVEPN
jgi:hypothetical protein